MGKSNQKFRTLEERRQGVFTFQTVGWFEMWIFFPCISCDLPQAYAKGPSESPWDFGFGIKKIRDRSKRVGFWSVSENLVLHVIKLLQNVVASM